MGKGVAVCVGVGCCVGGPDGSEVRIGCTGCAGANSGAVAVEAGRGVSGAATATASSGDCSPQAIRTTAAKVKMVATMALTGITYLFLTGQEDILLAAVGHDNMVHPKANDPYTSSQLHPATFPSEVREGLDPGHHQPAVRRMDRGVRIRDADRSAAGQADSPRTHPGDEWRKLQAERAGRRDAVFGLTCRPNPRLTRADIMPEQRYPRQT